MKTGGSREAVSLCLDSPQDIKGLLLGQTPCVIVPGMRVYTGKDGREEIHRARDMEMSEGAMWSHSCLEEDALGLYKVLPKALGSSADISTHSLTHLLHPHTHIHTHSHLH